MALPYRLGHRVPWKAKWSVMSSPSSTSCASGAVAVPADTSSPAAKPTKAKVTKGQLVQSAILRSAVALVDIGCNLGDDSFDKDRPDVLQRAREANVRTLIMTGTSVHSSRAAMSLCDKFSTDSLYFTAGVHPHSAKSCDDKTLDELRRLAEHPKCVAIGECGLDFNRDFSPRPVQLEWFEKQVELSLELNKPLFLHCRDASSAFVEVLKRHHGRADRPLRGVVHCFTGSREELLAVLELDMHVGITGWICDDRPDRGGQELAALLPLIPRHRLMIETDAPYLTPRTITPSKSRPSRNEPALLPHVLHTAATALACTPEELAKSTSETAISLFGLAPLAT